MRDPAIEVDFFPAGDLRGKGVPSVLRAEVEWLDRCRKPLADAMASLHEAAGLKPGGLDPAGDIHVIPPTSCDLFGDADPEGRVVYRRGSRLTATPVTLLRYRPVPVAAAFVPCGS